MNIFSITLFLLPVVMFAVVLRTFTSINQLERQKFLAIYLALGISFLISFWAFRGKVPTMSIFIPNIFVFASTAPLLIARFLNTLHAKNKQKIFQIQTSAPETPTEIFGIIFMFLFSLIFIIPSILDDTDKVPTHGLSILYPGIGLLVFAILSIILFSINILQKTVFFSDGFSHKGIFWKWSDFQTYVWKSHVKKKDIQGISLITVKGIWIRQVNFFISNQNKELIDALLAKEIKKISESS